MTSMTNRPILCLPLLAAFACGDDSTTTDSATGTASPPATTGPDAPTSTGPDAPTGGSSSVGGTGGATGTTGGETTVAITGTDTGAATTTTGDPSTSSTTGSSGEPGTSSSGGDESTSSTTEPIDLCKVQDEGDGMIPCTDKAPPDSFEPDIQWKWFGADGNTQVVVTPAVANLTDDNGDGVIDLCDVPDIVAVAYPGPNNVVNKGTLYLLDGATGAVHWSVPNVNAITYPAVGDIDGDGVPEIVTGRTLSETQSGSLLVINADGSEKFVGPDVYNVGSAAVALADLDADGDVEIYHHATVFDHTGKLLWAVPNSEAAYVNTAADLDGDGKLEVILGPRAFHHDGSPYYTAPIGDGHPQVADLDDDGLPEVLVITLTGLAILEHDGTVKLANQVPNLANYRPAAIHDLDGDLKPELAVVSANTYASLEVNMMANWTAPVSDGGFASSTAFDFLGDGTAEAMYADESALFIFGDMGQVLLTSPRGSWTQWENPIVADVDNDGSAEIVVVSNKGYANFTEPAIQVIRDKEDRWIPARRIWNQHAYHVTNVREDGTIPQVEPKSWELLNTFRTQAQISVGGGVCQPEPQ